MKPSCPELLSIITNLFHLHFELRKKTCCFQSLFAATDPTPFIFLFDGGQYFPVTLQSFSGQRPSTEITLPRLIGYSLCHSSPASPKTVSTTPTTAAAATAVW
mmetsp:Transcript_46247/g.104809  ORF Transcript_46247/g.104809 Transcript_46247/m.104809 type:complete len:103 (-) Transcript_46247:127-435(-)